MAVLDHEMSEVVFFQGGKELIRKDKIDKFLEGRGGPNGNKAHLHFEPLCDEEHRKARNEDDG